MNVKELRRFLNEKRITIHRTTVTKLAATGKIPAQKKGREWHFNLSDLDLILKVVDEIGGQREILEQEKLGFLPLAQVFNEIGSETSYHLVQCTLMEKIIPTKDIKRISAGKTMVVLFKATPENIKGIREFCEKRKAAQKLLSSPNMARRLKEKYGIKVGSDELTRWAKAQKLPEVKTVKNGHYVFFDPRQIRRIKRNVLEIRKPIDKI